jgi:hypothetical protein
MTQGQALPGTGSAKARDVLMSGHRAIRGRHHSNRQGGGVARPGGLMQHARGRGRIPRRRLDSDCDAAARTQSLRIARGCRHAGADGLARGRHLRYPPPHRLRVARTEGRGSRPAPSAGLRLDRTARSPFFSHEASLLALLAPWAGLANGRRYSHRRGLLEPSRAKAPEDDGRDGPVGRRAHRSFRRV